MALLERFIGGKNLKKNKARFLDWRNMYIKSLNYYTKRVRSGSWRGWVLAQHDNPRVLTIASTRDEIETLARGYVKEAEGVLRLRDSKGRYYDVIDYRDLTKDFDV